MKSKIILLLTTLSLIGCAPVDLGDSRTKPLILPTVRNYSLDRQQAAAAEIEFLMKSGNARPEVLQWLKDYDVMIQQTRAAGRILKASGSNNP